MSTAAPLQSTAAKSSLVSKSSHAGLLLQRKCACGGPASSSLSGECEECNSKRLQKKLSIGASNDPLEREADRVADQVMSAPAHSAVTSATPSIQRFTGQSTGDTGTAPASVDSVLASSGRPLDAAIQQDMGQRFGHDFSRVRIHTDTQAAESARAVRARAYTVGQDVVFAANRYAPTSQGGRELLAHELAHTIQQRNATGAPPSTDPQGILESSACAAGRDVANGQAVSRDFPASGVGLSRSPDDDGEDVLVQMITEAAPVFKRLAQAVYPEREADLAWLEAWKVRFKQRAALVAEARAILERPEKEAKDDDNRGETPDPKATLSLIQPVPELEVPELEKYQGFENPEKKMHEEEIERIDKQISKEREISKKPYYDRFQQALYRMSKETYLIDEDEFSSRSYSGLLVQTPDDLWKWGVDHVLFLPSEEAIVKADAQQQARRTYEKRFANAQIGTYRKDLTEPSTREEVWHSGNNRYLFLPSEKEKVIADREKYLEEREGREREARAQEKINSEIQRDRNWIAQGEQRSAPQGILQPVIVAAAAGPLVAAAYFGTQTGAGLGEAYNACAHGTAADCAKAVVPLGVDVAFQVATKVKRGAGVQGGVRSNRPDVAPPMARPAPVQTTPPVPVRTTAAATTPRTTPPTARDAAINFRAKYPKLDQSSVTLDGLEDIFRRTMSGTRRLTHRFRRYLPSATRGAAGELDAIQAAQRDAAVIRIRVVPPQVGRGAQRTPDLEVDVQLPDGSIVTQAREVRTVTGGRVGYQDVGSRQGIAADSDAIANAIRAKIFPSGKPSQLAGGGDQVIQVRRGGPNVDATIATAVNLLNPRLIGARFLRELHFHLPNRRVVRYVRAPDGTFVAVP